MNSKIPTNSFAILNKSSLTAVALTFAASLTGCGAMSGAVDNIGSKVISGITVKAVTPEGAYRAGQKIELEVSFPSAVQVAGHPALELSTGRTAAQAIYVSGSGSSKLIFDYTIQSGDNIAVLDYLNTSALNTDAGSIKPLRDGELKLTLQSPGEEGSISHSKRIAIDTIAPTAVSNLNDGTGGAGLVATPIATWDPASDASAITYEIMIGTTAGASDVLDWTTKTALTTAAHTGLSLVAAGLYHTSVRAVDAAGNIGPATNGNGWRAVDPLTFSQAAPVLVTNERFSFSSLGGFGPFSFSNVSGAGTLTGNIFRAPASADTSIIKVQDSLPSEATSTITTRAFEHVLTTSQNGTPAVWLEDMAYDAFGNLYAVGYHQYNGISWLVAKYDGTTWTVLDDTRLGATYGASATAILVNSPNDIYVVGHTMNGGDMKWIVRHFDGTTWTTSDQYVYLAGYSAYASDIVRGNDGSIYVVGTADESLNVQRWIVRRLSSGTWTTSDSYRRGGTSNRSQPQAAAVAPDGSVYVCGEAIVGATGNPDWVVRKFNGTSWSEAEVYGIAAGSEGCRAIAIDSSNNVYAAGTSTTLANEVRKWNGTSWTSLGSLTHPDFTFLSVNDMALDSSERPVLVYVGHYNSSSFSISWVVGRYEPTATLLHTFGKSESTKVTRQPSGDIVVGGQHVSGLGGERWHFRKIGVTSLDFLTEYELTKPTSHYIHDSAYDSSGNLYSVGYIDKQPGWNQRYWQVRKFDGTTWTEVDLYVHSSANNGSEAREILIDSSDNIYVVGSAYDDLGELHWIVRKFDGTSWTTSDDFHPSGEQAATSIVAHAGSIYVGGMGFATSGQLQVVIRKFDGTSWSAFQTVDVDPTANFGQTADLVVDSFNNFWIAAAYVAESYSTTHIRILKFDGSTWTTAGSSPNVQTVESLKLAKSAADDIFQSLTTYNGTDFYGSLKRFNGTSWTDFETLGISTRHVAMKSDASGNIYFGGTSSAGTAFIKKWNGYFFDEVYSPSLLSGYTVSEASAFAFGPSGRMGVFVTTADAADMRADTALYRLAP